MEARLANKLICLALPFFIPQLVAIKPENLKSEGF